MVDIHNLWDEPMMSHAASVDLIKKMFRKLNLLCHPDQGKTQCLLVYRQWADGFLSDRETQEACKAYECIVTDNLVNFKNKKDFWNLCLFC